MRQQAGTRAAALDRPRRQRRLVEPLAPATVQARAHDALHHEAAGDVFQLLGDIFAEPLETAAAIGASLARRKNRLFARQMLRQGAALRLSLRTGQRGRERLCSPRDLFVLQSELELVQGLRTDAETLPAQTRKLVLELLDRKIAVRSSASRAASSAREVSTIALSAATSSGRDPASSSMAAP